MMLSVALSAPLLLWETLCPLNLFPGGNVGINQGAWRVFNKVSLNVALPSFARHHLHSGAE